MYELHSSIWDILYEDCSVKYISANVGGVECHLIHMLITMSGQMGKAKVLDRTDGASGD